MSGEMQYLNLLEELALNGVHRVGRNGGTYGLFGRQIRFDLAHGFPLLTTKKVPLKSIILELLWFLRGETNIKTLGCGIWDEWADKDGELGPIYGKQWRSWRRFESYGPGAEELPPIDQITNVIEGLRKDPYGRRHIVTAWNPAEIDDMALPPCHCLFQFHVADGRLNCQLYQRSADIFLGVPFNIASYALLTMMVAQAVDLRPGEFIHTFGDVHLYANHVDQAWTQLARETRPLPKMSIAKNRDITSYQLGDFTLTDYNPWPAIPAEVTP